jgi:hypothetical protein
VQLAHRARTFEILMQPSEAMACGARISGDGGEDDAPCVCAMRTTSDSPLSLPRSVCSALRKLGSMTNAEASHPEDPTKTFSSDLTVPSG